MGKEIVNEYGKIVISEEVVATVAGVAAIECYGLVGMVSRNMIKDGIVDLLHKENLSRGVEVRFVDDRVVIDLYIIVGYGVRISQVANNVVDKVVYTVGNVLGLEVAQVNINVQGVRVSNDR
jgi:uncharacterized alkaline shock family protein YloU